MRLSGRQARYSGLRYSLCRGGSPPSYSTTICCFLEFGFAREQTQYFVQSGCLLASSIQLKVAMCISAPGATDR